MTTWILLNLDVFQQDLFFRLRGETITFEQDLDLETAPK